MDLEKLRSVFIGESENLLSRLEQALLTAEKNPADEGAIRTIFRVMHTLKGNAATMGFGRMAELAHHLEDILEPIMEENRRLPPGWVDFLLESLDLLRRLLHEFEAGKEAERIDIQPILARIRTMLEAPPTAAREGTEEASAAASAPAGGQASPSEKPAPPAAANGAWEDRRLRDPQPLQTTVRVHLRHLDNMMNLVGEIAIAKSRLLRQADELDWPPLSTEMKSLERLSAQLQEEMLQTRMVPVDDIFQRYVRVVRDTAHELGKEINFVIQDNGISIDRLLLEKINEPLVHLLRNGIDHGIETPEERVQAGKPPAGSLTLVARHEKNYAVIEVTDDGRGIDAPKVKEKAVALGVISAKKAQTMSEQEALYLICHPNLSTKENISPYSGRGIGMDIVQQMMQSINGHLDIRSEAGKGASFSLFLPLNLAIIQALLFKVGQETYALPLGDVVEIVSLSLASSKIADGREVIPLRDQAFPLVRLNRFFHVEAAGPGYALVVQAHNARYALGVDSCVGRQEVVLKSVSGFLKQIRGIAGATILGDGRAILILDAQGFL